MDEASRKLTFFLKDSEGDPGLGISPLPTVELDAEASETLQALAERAFKVAELEPLAGRTILFVGPPGPDGERSLVSYLDVGVNEDGLMFWRLGPGSANTTIADVERAAAAGLFEGDPHAYAVDRGGYGDSGLIEYWDDLRRFLMELGAVGGGALVVRSAAKWMLGFVDRHVGGWRERNARFPSTFLNSIVGRAEWDVSSLARLLDVPEEDARELLNALGYEEVADGAFRYSHDENKALLRKRLAEKHFLWDGWHEIKRPPSDEEPSGS